MMPSMTELHPQWVESVRHTTLELVPELTNYRAAFELTLLDILSQSLS